MEKSDLHFFRRKSYSDQERIQPAIFWLEGRFKREIIMIMLDEGPHYGRGPIEKQNDQNKPGMYSLLHRKRNPQNIGTAASHWINLNTTKKIMSKFRESPI